MDKKYFNHWADTEGPNYNFKNIFTAQQIVCEKYKYLENDNINPLTIRLCLLQQAFRNLFKERLNVRQKTSNPGYIYHDSETMSVSGVASSIVTVRKGYIGETFALNLHEVYKNLYAFCSFFSASLDRLAYELYILYSIGSPNKIDWRQLRTKNGDKGFLFNDLVQKNEKLSDVLLKEDFSRLLKIRDSLEHGKKIKISATSLGENFDFTIKCENSENEIVEFSHIQIMNLLNMCEEFYKSIID